MRHIESQIQQACVKWFRYKYPYYSLLLFHPKNEGHGNRIAGAIAKAEGVVAGVSDLILAVPRGRHNMLCIELKTPKGRQSPSQKRFQEAVEFVGARYVIVRDLDSFIFAVDDYLAEEVPSHHRESKSPAEYLKPHLEGLSPEERHLVQYGYRHGIQYAKEEIEAYIRQNTPQSN